MDKVISLAAAGAVEPVVRLDMSRLDCTEHKDIAGLSDGAYRLLVDALVECCAELNPVVSYRDIRNSQGQVIIDRERWASDSNIAELIEAGFFEQCYDPGTGQPHEGSFFVTVWESMAGYSGSETNA